VISADEAHFTEYVDISADGLGGDTKFLGEKVDGYKTPGLHQLSDFFLSITHGASLFGCFQTSYPKWPMAALPKGIGMGFWAGVIGFVRKTNIMFVL